jgi:hypothetical protein
MLHRMMRKTLTLRISYSEDIPAYESNLLDALMKAMRFDIFKYIVDEICNIATNPLRSCVFAPYIQYMIEVVTKEKFYKDSRHDLLRPAVPKDPRTSCASASASTALRTTRSDGASTAFRINSEFLKMFRGIFVMCQRIDQRLDVMK